MRQLIVEPHYLGSLEYYCLLLQHENVTLEVHDSFPKQTFRNRAHLLGSNKVLPVIIPLKYRNNTPTKEVMIDHSQRWVKDHWGAFYSSYGKAPFFDFLAEDYQEIWNRRHRFLLDLLLDFLQLTLRQMQLKLEISTTSSYEKEYESVIQDYRNTIHPKIDFSSRNIYEPIVYPQLFGDSFVSNLSIVDLIMCEGPGAAEILNSSTVLGK